MNDRKSQLAFDPRLAGAFVLYAKRAGAGIGCVGGIVTGEAAETPLIGTPMAPGNCAVGAIGGGLTAVGVFYIANARDIVSGSISEAKAVAQVVQNCF